MVPWEKMQTQDNGHYDNGLIMCAGGGMAAGNWSVSGNDTNISGLSLQTTFPEEDQYKQLYLNCQYVTGLICYPIICLFGLLGNLLSIIVLGQRKMRTSTNTYLIALAFSDAIKLLNDSFYFLVILLMNVSPLNGNKAYGYLYPYAHYFFNMSVCITAWLTVTVAAERYMLVCHPATARGLCTLHNARVTSVVIFVGMSALTVPLGLRYRTIRVYSNETAAWHLDVEVTELWRHQTFVTAYTWIQNLFRTIIPLVVLCTLNCFIMQALHRTRVTKKKLSSRHRITLMLISVIFVFVVCCTPDAVMSAVFGFGYTDADYRIKAVREITDLLLTVNSAVNFLLYCIFNKVFRQNFMTLIGSKLHGGRMQAEELTCRRSSYVTIRPVGLNGHHNNKQRIESPEESPVKEDIPVTML